MVRRKERLKGIAKAKKEIKKRASEHYVKEKEAYDKKMAVRRSKGQARGKTLALLEIYQELFFTHHHQDPNQCQD